MQKLKGLIIKEYGQTLLVETGSKIYECFARKNIASIAVGDYVFIEISDDSALNKPVIIERVDRDNVFSRRDRYHPCKEIAANLTQIMIVMAVSPVTNELYLDQYLCAAELNHLPVVLVFNKIDLLSNTHQDLAWLDYYESTGYPLVKISVSQNQNIDRLTAFLKDQRTLMLGISGVGKSSLLNLLAGQQSRVGAMSVANQKGQHTTSTCTLYHLPFGGTLFDAPGIREFHVLTAQQPDIIYGFREFKPFLGRCKFRNCQHLNDPGCVLQQALKDGKISETRFKNYLRILDSQV